MSININDFEEQETTLLSKMNNLEVFGVPLKKLIGASLLACTIGQAALTVDNYIDDVTFSPP